MLGLQRQIADATVQAQRATNDATELRQMLRDMVGHLIGAGIEPPSPPPAAEADDDASD